MDVFFIGDNDLLEKCIPILDKVGANIKKESDSELVYHETFLKTKIKSYSDEATDFHDEIKPKAYFDNNCLSVITTDFALEKDGNYYLQVFLKEHKYIETY